MDDLLDDGDGVAGGNTPEYSVSDLTGAVKRTLEGAFGRVRVRGEVGRVVQARSGHLYFDLKDDRSVIASVAWKGVAGRLQTKPEEGMEVVAAGRLSTFGPQSKYQLIVDDLAPAGLGALMVMLEKRKKALEAEGLFEASRKKPLPYLPDVIGVVTSPSGAVIRDILHRLRDRFPREVLLWPVLVQGEKSAREVTAAIEGFNKIAPGGPVARPDLLIVARGGGSIEDLWGFNEELVVRAAAASEIPLISAVGHETDVTLIDYVADRRAPTPTAAAEMAVPVRSELLAGLAALEERRVRAGVRGLADRKARLRDLARALPRPQAILAERTQAFDTLADRLPRALFARAQSARLALERQTGRFGPAMLVRQVASGQAAVQREAARLPSAIARHVARYRKEAMDLGQRVTPRAASMAAERGARLLGGLSERLVPAAPRILGKGRAGLAAMTRVLQTLDHRAVLNRGFALVHRPEGGLITDVSGAKGQFDIEFKDGRVRAVAGPASRVQGAAKKTAGDDSDGSQGSLF